MLVATLLVVVVLLLRMLLSFRVSRSMICCSVLYSKIIISNLIGSIVIFHICNFIIIYPPASLVELNDGAIAEMQVDCGVYLCVKCDAKSTCNLRK